jgi:uncharacterized protein (DUF169 family)
MWTSLAEALQSSLHPSAPPVAITFSAEAPAGVEPYDAPMPPPAEDGRTGRVPAGCVFWMRGAERTFTTAPEDHGNCSVGTMTHGLATMDEVSSHTDIAALLDSGWITADMIPGIPVVRDRPGAITYGPLADTPVDPDVILVRLTAKSLMVLSDALPGLRVEGKPQCHIVAAAKEQGEVVASVGCMLSRTRTGMSSGEVTCAIPASRLGEVVERLESTARADAAVASYAAEDARRFA